MENSILEDRSSTSIDLTSTRLLSFQSVSVEYHRRISGHIIAKISCDRIYTEHERYYECDTYLTILFTSFNNSQSDEKCIFYQQRFVLDTKIADFETAVVAAFDGATDTW